MADISLRLRPICLDLIDSKLALFLIARPDNNKMAISKQSPNSLKPNSRIPTCYNYILHPYFVYLD